MSFAGERDAWERRAVEPSLKRVPERRKLFTTASGLPVGGAIGSPSCMPAPEA